MLGPPPDSSKLTLSVRRAGLLEVATARPHEVDRAAAKVDLEQGKISGRISFFDSEVVKCFGSTIYYIRNELAFEETAGNFQGNDE